MENITNIDHEEDFKDEDSEADEDYVEYIKNVINLLMENLKEIQRCKEMIVKEELDLLIQHLKEIQCKERIVEKEIGTGIFRKECYLNGDRVPWDEITDILEENVLELERCCCSLTGWFPSGVFTLVTWPLTNHTVRHEYCILKTENHYILIELTGVDSSKKNAVISIKIVDSDKRADLLTSKYYHRCLKRIRGPVELNVGKVMEFVNLWIFVARLRG